MSFTSDSILEYLDKSDYPLLSVNYDIAAVRVTGFCNQETWAIVYELLMNYPSSDGIRLMLLVYGPGATVKQGFGTPLLHDPFAWRGWEMKAKELNDSEEFSIPKEIQVYIRGEQVTISLENFAKSYEWPAFDFDLLIHLIEIYREKLFSTDEELYLYVSKKLDKLVKFENWKHEDDWQHSKGAGVVDGDKFHIPSYTSGIEAMAKNLESRKFDLCQSQLIRDLGFDWETFE
jgi:hypothetical protein